MTWVIVVLVLIATGIALHFGEEAKSRAVRARRRTASQGQRPDFGRFLLKRQVQEEWDVDLERMTLRLTRIDPAPPVASSSLHQLERVAAGWQMRPNEAGQPAPDPSDPSAWRPVPGPMADELEARYRRFQAQAASGVGERGSD